MPGDWHIQGHDKKTAVCSACERMVCLPVNAVVSIFAFSLVGGLLFLYSIARIFYHISMNLAIGRKTINLLKLKRARPYAALAIEALEYGKWLETRETESVSVRSRDGYLLTGHYLPADHPERTLIMVHGWRSEWMRDFADMAYRLHRSGCNLLFIEQRAHGKSEGRYIGFGVLERFDCLEWVRYLVGERHEKQPIYLTGLSMGASTVLMTAGLPLPEEVKGIIADCGFTSPYEMVTRVAGQVLRVGPFFVNRVNQICCKKAGYSLKATTLSAMRKCRIPVLFVHGTADSLVPVEMTIQNYLACRAPKELLLVEGAGHCKSFTQDREGYLGAVNRFFSGIEEACASTKETCVNTSGTCVNTKESGIVTEETAHPITA